eukprot:m.292385 g.292385  ORF g.292385 m.292385 type:complete len:162 (-) comp17826_c0_seq6:4788-5273(-)
MEGVVEDNPVIVAVSPSSETPTSPYSFYKHLVTKDTLPSDMRRAATKWKQAGTATDTLTRLVQRVDQISEAGTVLELGHGQLALAATKNNHAIVTMIPTSYTTSFQLASNMLTNKNTLLLGMLATQSPMETVKTWLSNPQVHVSTLIVTSPQWLFGSDVTA